MKIIEAIGNIISPLIIIAFAVILICFFAIDIKVKALDAEMKKDRSRSKNRPRLSKDKKSVEDSHDGTNLDKNLDYLETFTQIRVNYDVLEQLIPIFPLMGILGTVAGLIPMLGNPEMMKEAMAVSMYTTFFGLIAAIVLKAIDALAVGKHVNKMAVSFEMFDQSYQIAKDQAMLENDKE